MSLKKTFCSTLNSWIGAFVLWCHEQVIREILDTFVGNLFSEKYFVDVKIVCNEKTFACDKAIQWQWIKKKLGWIATFSDVQCGKLRWSEKERKKNVTFEDSTMSTLEMMIERIRKLPKGRIFKNLCRKEIGSDISFDLDNS